MTSGTRTFGYEVTVFKFNHIRPPGFTTAVSLYRTDVAITDEVAHRFYQKVSYYFPGSATFSRSALNVHVGSAHLQGAMPQKMTLRAALPDGAIHLRLSSRRHAMDVGGRGYLTFANGYTYYYSLTDLVSSGTMRVGTRTFHVAGVSWLDHQWGSWSWTTVRGWTWMALQLDNGVQLSVFDFHSSASRQRAANVLLANGTLRTVSNITIKPSGSWQSPHTRAVYPNQWTVTIPSLGAVLHVKPTVPDQELISPGDVRGSYWEGSGRVHGTWNGLAVRGLTYTELTGFTR